VANNSSRTQAALNLLGPVLALVLLVAVFGAAEYAQRGESTFLSLRNSRTVAVQAAPVLMGALGMTLVIIAGGIDLSVGSLSALAAMTLGLALVNDYGIAAALVACILTGLLGGTLNGSLISYLRMPPFIVTLGTMTIFLGLAKLSNNNNPVRPLENQLPPWITSFLSPVPPEGWPLFGPGVWLVLGLAVVIALVLRYTVAGRYLYAVGSNERAAELCGIAVARLKVAIYALAGIFFALAGFYVFCRNNQQGSPTEGNGFELKVIAAVVVGGASLQGGRGTVLGTCCGTAIIAVVNSGCVQLGIRNELQDIMLGLIVISAVAIDQWRLRRVG
jgi:ribose transport system permease protein